MQKEKRDLKAGKSKPHKKIMKYIAAKHFTLMREYFKIYRRD